MGFASQFIEAAVNVALVAFVARWLAGQLTLASAKHIGFAVALGVALGRGQAAVTLSEIEGAGASLGAMIALGMIWFFWFKVSAEKSHG